MSAPIVDHMNINEYDYYIASGSYGGFYVKGPNDTDAALKWGSSVKCMAYDPSIDVMYCGGLSDDVNTIVRRYDANRQTGLTPFFVASNEEVKKIAVVDGIPLVATNKSIWYQS